MTNDKIIHTTDASFEQDVLNSAQPVLLDFWAPWCGPCNAISPTLSALSLEYEGKVRIAKINIDENQQIPAKYGIRSIPTLMIFKNGELAATKVGALTKIQLEQFIEQYTA